MSRFVNFAASGWFRATASVQEDMQAEGDRPVLDRIRDRINEVLADEFDGLDFEVIVQATATPEMGSAAERVVGL